METDNKKLVILKNEYIPELVYKNLPRVLKNVTDIFSGRERDIVLLSSLGVLSCSIPNVYGIYDGDKVYPNLFVLIIAPPASGKGVMNFSKILVQRIHSKILEDSKLQNSICQAKKKKDKDKDFVECPQLELKIIPANISTSEMYSYLNVSKNGVLIIESEADTLSNMLKNDWSNYSDLLRKAFHHESISLSRQLDSRYIEIDEPKMSMIVSGTPDQLQPLIKSKGNGLFSRFLMYSFDEVSGFKNVFAPQTHNYKEIFEKSGNVVYDLYGKMFQLKDELLFKLTDNQYKRFLKDFMFIHKDILENHSHDVISSLHRHGLIMFRLCMILTVLRNVEEISEKSELVCSNRDFITALKIIKVVLKHAIINHNSLNDGGLSDQDEELLFSLNPSFTRKEAIKVGEELNIPQRTIDDKLKQWQKKKAIKKVEQGKYKRL
ncbi:DUF3987 domain-containing protein [Flavobacterium sp. KACC 22763]|uniref:DUF3987 domain-containing protein n=1 Tax=Flavobacterium sp. KACC 22763 TaxID=3025668 RepID=UPI002365EA94|nr:DUF3987 domain-containing protein [Flavobacterium sp. KACC 22763]WDF63182.1 DUF3987 domain-containing protein [Flavobacterium sp. KACC 22763]